MSEYMQSCSSPATPWRGGRAWCPRPRSSTDQWRWASRRGGGSQRSPGDGRRRGPPGRWHRPLHAWLRGWRPVLWLCAGPVETLGLTRPRRSSLPRHAVTPRSAPREARPAERCGPAQGQRAWAWEDGQRQTLVQGLPSAHIRGTPQGLSRSRLVVQHHSIEG